MWDILQANSIAERIIDEFYSVIIIHNLVALKRTVSYKQRIVKKLKMKYNWFWRARNRTYVNGNLIDKEMIRLIGQPHSYVMELAEVFVVLRQWD